MHSEVTNGKAVGAARGEQNGNNKLTEADAREIVALKGKFSQRELAAMFNVSRSAIVSIHNGRNWRWINRA